MPAHVAYDIPVPQPHRGSRPKPFSFQFGKLDKSGASIFVDGNDDVIDQLRKEAARYGKHNEMKFVIEPRTENDKAGARIWRK